MMAFACGLLIAPPSGVEEHATRLAGNERALSDVDMVSHAIPGHGDSSAKTPEELQAALNGINQGALAAPTPDLGSLRSSKPGLAKPPEELQMSLNEPSVPLPSVAPNKVQTGEANRPEPANETGVSPPPAPIHPTEQGASLPPEQRWGQDIEWPTTWSKTTTVPTDSDDQQPTTSKNET
jgi:hypothetical protein